MKIRFWKSVKYGTFNVNHCFRLPAHRSTANPSVHFLPVSGKDTWWNEANTSLIQELLELVTSNLFRRCVASPHEANFAQLHPLITHSAHGGRLQPLCVSNTHINDTGNMCVSASVFYISSSSFFFLNIIDGSTVFISNCCAFVHFAVQFARQLNSIKNCLAPVPRRRPHKTPTLFSLHYS